MQKKFKGVLATPIKPRQLHLLMDEAEIREQRAKWAAEDYQKLLLLCEHYGIPTTPIGAFTFYDLAMRLAQDFVPGFQEEVPRGRKQKWHIGNMGALVVEIERLVQSGDESHGVFWAAGVLAKREPWKSFLDTSREPKAVVQKVYYNFREDLFAEICRKAFAYHELQNDIDGWEQGVIRVCE